jgi:hypothetical protein
MTAKKLIAEARANMPLGATSLPSEFSFQLCAAHPSAPTDEIAGTASPAVSAGQESSL